MVDRGEKIGGMSKKNLVKIGGRIGGKKARRGRKRGGMK